MGSTVLRRSFLKGIVVSVVAAVRVGERRWDLKMKQGTKVMLPEEHPEKAWQYLADLERSRQILSDNLRQIDLRLDEKTLQHARAGKVRLLGVTTKKRVAAIPDVPTIDEAGLPGFESFTWFAIFGPKGLEPAIAEKMNLAIKRALDDPETRKKLAELGNTPRYETLDQFRATVKADRARWAAVVKAVGAKVD